MKALGRRDLDEEPTTEKGRIRWHVLRAMEWLYAASRDELIRQGEPFELPAYPYRDGRVVGFLEDEASFGPWSSALPRGGLVELIQYPGNDRVFVVRQFSTWSGEPLFTPRWGKRIIDCDSGQPGLWVLWDELPVLPPWQPPTTGREFQQAAQKSGQSIRSFLDEVPDCLRDGKPHFLLIGFPVSRLYREAPERVHWLAVELPPFSRLKKIFPGFKPGRKGSEMSDRQRFLSMTSVPWIRTENWSEDQISSRGRFRPELRQKEILLIGAGALGSAVAELLVRGGAYRLKIMDGDTVIAGNLVRHSLSMTDVGRSKAESLASWLNQISPHAQVVSSPETFPPDSHRTIDEAEVVIDCTGDDDTLLDLVSFPWPREMWFMSASLGLHAQRLFLFIAKASTFPRAELIGSLQPWLQKERERAVEEGFPWEGIGCWSPVFPARVDDVRLFASVVVSRLDRWVSDSAPASGLLVFERDESECLVRQAGTIQHG